RGAVDTAPWPPHKPGLLAPYAPVRMQRETAGECPERQRGRTVNPLADAFVGSSPTSPTSAAQKGQLERGKRLRGTETDVTWEVCEGSGGGRWSGGEQDANESEGGWFRRAP